MERLCFGTFMDILIQCKSALIDKTNLTQKVIKTIDRECDYTGSSGYQALNRLYKCSGDFTITYTHIRELAPNTEKHILLERFEDDVIPLIDPDKYTLLILALCDIIKKDATLNPEKTGENIKKFEKYINKDINDFLNSKEYILSEFLTSIFRYTVIEVKNTAGKEWIKNLPPKYQRYDNFFAEYIMHFQDEKDKICILCDTKPKTEESHTVTQDSSFTKPKAIPDNPVDSQDANINRRIGAQNEIPAAEISIPKEYRTCVCCEYFKKAATVHKNVTGVKGKCSLQEKIVSQDESCDYFCPNDSKIASKILLSNLDGIKFF